MSQFHNHAQSLKVTDSGGPLDNQTWHTYKMAAHNKSFTKSGFRTHTTALRPMEKSSMLSAESDCPMACQNAYFPGTVHDC